MKEYKILKFLDHFQGFFQRNNIDYKMLRRILQLKLTMDDRRVPTVMNNYNQKKEGKNNLNSSLLLYGFIGIFIGIMVIIPAPVFVKMNIVLGMLIFMVMSTMVSDFSTVLLDINDKNVLLPRPITNKTINTAKIIHITIYLSKLTIAISAAAFLIGTIRYGIIYAVLFLLTLILMSGFIIFFTAILYFLVLSFFDGEKLKDIINYFQIVLSIVMMVAYQFMGRAFQLVDVKISDNFSWWVCLLPSAWFSAPFSLFLEGSKSTMIIILSILSLLIPLISIMAYLKFIAPYFEKNLQKLNDNSYRKDKKADSKIRRHAKVAGLLSRNKDEKAFYRFTQDMISSERKLKLTIYPSLAFAVVMPFIFLVNIFSDSKSINEAISKLSNGKYYFALYITLMMLSLVIISVNRSERYKAAWLYKVLPIENPSPVFKGTFKGLLIKILAPAYTIPAIVFLVVSGPRIIPSIILIFMNMVLTSLLILKIATKELPFSRDFTYKSENNIVVVFGSFGIVGALAVIHVIASFIPFGIAIAIIISGFLILLVWKLCFNISWDKVINSYE